LFLLSLLSSFYIILAFLFYNKKKRKEGKKIDLSRPIKKNRLVRFLTSTLLNGLQSCDVVNEDKDSLLEEVCMIFLPKR
jgi:hypothetical protein